jgi:hypothetical protein
LAIDIRIRTETFEHPLTHELLELGRIRLPFFELENKRFKIAFNRKLRWIGAFLAAAKWYPNLDLVTNAIFVSVLRELGYINEFNNARNVFQVQGDLLFAVDALFEVLKPLTKARSRHS